MFWKLSYEDCTERMDLARTDGRFVLHRHRDEAGDHLDLRLEQDGYLLGWRIGAGTLEGEPWATEKAPHPVRWLEQDGDAVRVDAGVYAWFERGPGRRGILLRGRNGVGRVRLERAAAPDVAAIRGICEALEEHHAAAEDAAGLIRDGVAARRRGIERFCGLGRELDGGAFDAAVWRRTLERLSLEEIHAQLRAYEVRFDQKYPPAPVSRPETLPPTGSGAEDRAEMAISIARE